MRAKDLLCEFYDPAEDSLQQWDYDDTRRPRLTFHQLGKMRRSRDMEKLDRLERQNFLPDMYNDSGEGDGLGF